MKLYKVCNQNLLALFDHNEIEKWLEFILTFCTNPTSPLLPHRKPAIAMYDPGDRVVSFYLRWRDAIVTGSETFEETVPEEDIAFVAARLVDYDTEKAVNLLLNAIWLTVFDNRSDFWRFYERNFGVEIPFVPLYNTNSLSRIQFYRPNPQDHNFSIFNYLGGKKYLRKWIGSRFPKTAKTFVEPFVGSGRILFESFNYSFKRRVISDLDAGLIALYNDIKDQEKALLLQKRLFLTPYARSLFAKPTGWPGYDFFRHINMAFSATPDAVTAGRLAISFLENRPLWMYQKVANISTLTPYLTDVEIYNRNALDVIAETDGEDTLFYLDPPYPASTRSNTGKYRYEQDDDFHRELEQLLLNVKGFVLLSTYKPIFYENLIRAGWRMLEKEVPAHSVGVSRNNNVASRNNHKRVEVLLANFDVGDYLNMRLVDDMMTETE